MIMALLLGCVGPETFLTISRDDAGNVSSFTLSPTAIMLTVIFALALLDALASRRSEK